MTRDKLDRKLERILRRLVRGESSFTTPQQLLKTVDGKARKGRKFEEIRERLRENNLYTEPDWETCSLNKRVEFHWFDPDSQVYTKIIESAERHRRALERQEAEQMQMYLERRERERKRNQPSMLSLIFKEIFDFFV